MLRNNLVPDESSHDRVERGTLIFISPLIQSTTRYICQRLGKVPSGLYPSAT